ncbi:hypothetical protein PFISCL1PPCAC_1794, partial [Pristionchus fissidentatus]
FLFSSLFITTISPLKFLSYSPQFAKSHVNFMARISDVLVEVGHEVVILSPIVDKRLGGVGTKKTRLIEVPQCSEAVAFEDFMQNSGASSVWTSTETISAFYEWDEVFHTWIAQCNATISHPGLIEKLKAEKFDAAIAESMDFCAPGLFHLLGIEKWAITDSLAIVDANFFYTQTPSNPAYVPTMMGGNMGEEMSFFDRFNNLFAFLLSEWFNRRYFSMYHEMFKTHNKEIPPVEELFPTNSLVFTNSEPLVDFPRPSSARVIDIGGISVSSGHKKLNETWSSILDLRPKTVFISFGTVAKASLMPQEYKNSVLDVVKSFPNVTFIWKYEEPSDRISEGIDNLIESTWVPQNDLLHDSRVSAFITHCGQGSTTEAISAGVPLVVIPVAYDQLRNAQQVKRNGHGVMLEKTELASSETLKKAVKEVLENRSYKKNAMRIKSMIEERPFTMKEIFVRNMEFLAVHGPLRQLDHYGRHLNFFQYYLIDVIASFIGTFVIALVLVVIALKFLITRLLGAIGVSKRKID